MVSTEPILCMNRGSSRGAGRHPGYLPPTEKKKTYRVELFGNEVDSIRIFDPETQLSERKLLQVNIIPNVETQFEDGDKVFV